MDQRAGLDRMVQRRYGLECADAVRFEAGSWDPGGEHVRQLSVRNVSHRTIKFKYELPRTKQFSMPFPTLQTLSPGMALALTVTFRPVKREEYDDFVGFQVHVIDSSVPAISGRFQVPVLARISTLKVEIPHSLDIGCCPTNETSCETFILHNCGQLDAQFDWQVAEQGNPFAIRPENGQVQAGASIELKATFCPEIASVYAATTFCTIKPSRPESDLHSPTLVKTMLINGISKFTHLTASETELNFGDVLIGVSNSIPASTEKELVLHNPSPVRASFRITSVEKDHEPRFVFTPVDGIVAPEATIPIKVRHTPQSAGTFWCDHFYILTPGGNRILLTCKGRAIGPVVSIWRKNQDSILVPTRSINFHDVPVGETPISRVIILRNESPLEVFFQLDAPLNGIFCFDQVTGKIPPFLDLHLTLSFAPPCSGNFYRRAFLLLYNQSTQFLDVLGTGYTDKMRPSPFQQAHVDSYRLRAAAGLGRLSPHQLDMYRQENGDEMFLKGALQRTKAATTNESIISSPILTRSGEASMAAIAISNEYFVNIEEKTNPVVLVNAILDFGSNHGVQVSSTKLLVVTNNTHSKVTCSWHVAMVSEITSEPPVFQVFPSSSDIAPDSTVEFRVTFHPCRGNTYYFAELEGFAAFKSNRTFRLVNVNTLTPPWCLVAKACGNTFSSSLTQFLPKIRFRGMKNKVQFPPCYLGDSVFQTIVIENVRDTPAWFAIAKDPTEIFACQPTCGYIGPKSFHLVVIRCTPRSVRTYSHMLQVVVNNAPTQPEVLELRALGALPQLCLQDFETESLLSAEPKIYIKPTSVGLQSQRQLQLINTSRVPLVYRWEVPLKYEHVFQITPQVGRLNGRETALIDCSFTPDEMRDYACHFLVVAKSISVPFDQKTVREEDETTLSNHVHELTVRVQSKSTIGALQIHPPTVNFDTVLVHSSSYKTFFLENRADCELQFSLHQSIVQTTTAGNTRQADNGSRPIEDKENSHSVPTQELVFSEAEGCVSAKSRKKITVTFSPVSSGVFTFQVSCVIGSQTASISRYDVQESSKTLAATNCQIQAEAAFPTLEITDLRVPGIPTPLAWHQFQCNEINEYLAAPEVEETLHDRPPKRFVLPFSPARLRNHPEHVFLKLQNPGNLVVTFRLRYPTEDKVEMEHWAERHTPSEDEVRVTSILESKVFTLSPRQATLQPHESILLSLSYSYTSQAYDGKHTLPVRFEIENGKNMILDLHGQTLVHSGPQLFLPSRTCHLSPVSIGEYRPDFGPSTALAERQSYSIGGPPVQQLVVFNRGDDPLCLDIDSTSFDHVNAANYGYQVLECTTKTAVIPAQRSIFLDIKFNPIQMETIEVPLVLKAHDLMRQVYENEVKVTIVATGYHPFQQIFEQVRSELRTNLAPKTQALSIPEFPVTFVSDFVDFGHVSMHSKAHQLLILQHETCGTVDFEWDLQHPLVTSGILAFSPQRGTLEPGKQVVIRLSIVIGKDAMVVNHDVACFITFSDESKPNKGKNVSSTSTSVALKTDAKKPRTSVVNRSIATQEAVAVAEKQGNSNRQTSDDLPFDLTKPVPLFVRIYAHVLSIDVMERIYSHQELMKRPLVITKPISHVLPVAPSSGKGVKREMTTSTRRLMSRKHSEDNRSIATRYIMEEEEEAVAVKGCYHVLHDVMETLVMDVLTSSAVQNVLHEHFLPLKRSERARKHTKTLEKEANAGEDYPAVLDAECQMIVTELMENTVVNVLQDLFYSDLTHELACVPRKSVFPNLPDSGGAATTNHDASSGS